MNIERLVLENAIAVSEKLDELTEEADHDYAELFQSVRYSLLSKGKRIRPFLTNAFSTLFEGDRELSLRFACALEMIHTYSLIHDDLPCMDDDDLRRGVPTNHKVYGEATAMLAGDALLTLAFQTVADDSVPAPIAVRATRLLAEKAGLFGMIGGQAIDLKGESEHLDFETVLKMHRLKTGALIEAACLLGCFSAGILEEDDPRYLAAAEYAEKIGETFQIVDDRLDVVSTDEELGKPVGSDEKSHKTTALSFMTPDQALDYATDLTQQAKSALQDYEGHEILDEFADLMLNRNH